MYPPFYEQISSNSLIQASLGAEPRVFPVEAPENAIVPYAVFDFTASPENYLNRTPDIEQHTVEVSIYGDSFSQSVAAAEDLRKVIETFAHVISLTSLGRDKDTRLWAYSIVFDWWYTSTT